MAGDVCRKIWAKLHEGVLNYDEEIVVNASRDVLNHGLDIYECIMQGLLPGIEEVGELYERGEYFIAEMLMCSDALYAGLNVLRPHIKKENHVERKQVVIGVVAGDIHDIGKNIIKMMFDAAGFEVHDLGCDVPLDKFVNEQLRTDAEIVCLSAMMTTTMNGMSEIIRRIREKSPGVKIMIGGAPVNGYLANQWGADSYADNANNAIKYAIEMISMLKSLEKQRQAN
jgi:methanogenic corrinoid protein MtbC1